MSDIDRTYERLLRTPFKQVVQEIYNADPMGSYTFNRMNPEEIWRVSPCYEYICINHGWNVDDFNKQVQEEFNVK